MGYGRHRVAAAVISLAVAVFAPRAGAQIRLPAAPLPSPRSLAGLTAPIGATADPLVEGARAELRKLRIDELLRAQRHLLDADRAGNPLIRGEILAFAPSEAAIALAANDGLTVIRRQVLTGLDAELVVLSVPQSRSIHRALKRLREADPAGTYDYNHVYLGVGEPVGPAAPLGQAAEPMPPFRPSGPIGLIDSGVDVRHPAFKDATVRIWGCAGVPAPDAHGTAVASLIVGRDRGFRGAAPGAVLYAADVYCGRADGGALDVIAGAFGWLTAEHVPVISVSLVGPNNVTLAAIVSRVIGRGALIVAAVGNDGPSAPPLYPAAYPGVIGVTGVDARRRVLLEANRGPQVAFAAPGADMAAAAGSGYREVRGTSFAAPIVAGLLAAYCQEPGPTCTNGAPEALARQAIGLGSKGRNPVYGYGLVGEAVRTAAEK